jgi:hypothetical protein|uniref:SRPBCC family protein n=1 Tax=Microbacterium sp. LWH7-1.2 TaxID=3135257 RepID=UPI004053510E
MSRNVRVLQCTPEDVFEVLADGWLYPSWVVGASRMREVDETWPMADAELHHSFGVWPLLINDKTLVEEFVPSRRMVMKARGWPIGEARVTIDVKPRGDRCVVRIQEEAVAGPGRFVPAPLMDIALHWRNDETLHRLAYLAEGTAARRAAATTAEREMAASGETQQVDAAPSGDAVAVEASPGGAEETDAAMSDAGAGPEPVVPTGESEWVDAATSIDAVEAGPADEPGESESLPPMTSGDDGGSERPAAEEPDQGSAASQPSDVDERVARADEAGASAGTPEDSWNPMSGAGESEPVAPDEDGAPQT